MIGDDVEIGANTTVDRGALDDTVIEEGVKLDNQIQIAHNVRIGAHTAIAACAGIAGSATDRATLPDRRRGGHCRPHHHRRPRGNLRLHPGHEIDQQSRAPTPGPIRSSRNEEWRRNAAQLRHLAELAQRVRALEKKPTQPKRSKP